MTRSSKARHRDSGLTLVELLVVTVMLGLVAVVITATFTTIIRTSAPAQFRVDDARSTRGLQTWLIRDAASAPRQIMVDAADLTPGGYVLDPVPAWSEDCNAPGTNVIHMAWVDASTSDRYFANYTLDGTTIYRTVCTSAAPTGTPLRITGDIATTFCSSAPFSDAAYARATLTGSEVTSIELCVRSLDSGSGLNAAGGDTQAIILSVSSRNGVEIVP